MSKITKTLTLYFTAILLVFSLITGVTFIRLYSNNIVEANKEILMNNAQQIASNLAEYLESSNQQRSHRMGMSHQMGRRNELNSFIKIVDQISYGDVWLVDKDKTIITNSMHSSEQLSEEVSSEGIQLIEEALLGDSGYSESFHRDERTMAVSVPAINSSNEIVAAVLVLAPINGSNAAIKDGLNNLLFSGLIALVLSVILAIVLSRKFVKPIKKINDTTKLITDEQYDIKTNVNQDDEIGELAQSIDILSKRLMDAKRQRERYDQERKQFYVDISHELRTPVTVLKGSLELLTDDKIQSIQERDEYHEQMLKEITYLENMLNDLLDYSKLNNSDFELPKTMINMSDVLSDAIRSMRRVAEVNNVSLINNNEYFNMPLQGNYEKLRQMFVIVLDNAIKYSYEGSSVELNVEEKIDRFIVSIVDNGKGIREEDLPYIFDRYYKDENMKGTGIGLALSKEIAIRHDIEITASSSNNETVFSFVIVKPDDGGFIDE